MENTLRIHPSNAVWTQDGLWYAQITIWLNDEQGSVTINKAFQDERAAMQWRADLIEIVQHSSVEVRGRE